MTKINPTYYAIITADVRYDNDLPPNAKLLFGEISALSNATGECTAGNNYFAQLYDVKPTTVSEWVSLLREKGYVTVFVDHARGNKRTIRLPIPEKPKTSSGKAEDPSSGKAEDNNTSINNIAHTPDSNDDALRIYNLYLKYFISNNDTGLAPEIYRRAVHHYRLTPKRAAAIKRRIEDSGVKMVKAAIVGYGQADWSNGNNDRRWKADLADFICRSYENIERGARLYEDQRKAPGGNDAWASLAG